MTFLDRDYDLQCYGLADYYKEDLVRIMLLNEWLESFCCCCMVPAAVNIAECIGGLTT